MKRFLPLLLLLCLSAFLFSSCGNSPAAAAKKILSDLSDGDTSVYGTLFDSDSVELSEQERFVLSRMTWKCAEMHLTDDTHAAVTVHIHTHDMMDLMNQALIRSLSGADPNFDTTAWMLLQLNSGAAPKADFEAVMPLVLDGSQLTLDTAAGEDVLDGLRDAVSGGAYSWFRIYRETFGAE